MLNTNVITYDTLLQKYNIEDYTYKNIKPYKDIIPNQYFKFKTAIDNLKGKTVLTPVDDDTDGFVCVKELYDAFTVDTKHCTICPYFNKEKSHGLTDEVISVAIKQNFDVVLITDSSSNCLEQIKKLTTKGIQIIVIDHHKIEINVEDLLSTTNLTFLSTQLETNTDLRFISAGFYVYLLINQYLKDIYNKDFLYEFQLASLSIVSDVCDMRSHFNRSILKEAYNCIQLNYFINEFIDSYRAVNYSLFGFRISPILNALFRMREIELLYKLILSSYNTDKLQSYVSSAISKYSISRNITMYYKDTVKTFEFDNLVIGYIGENPYIGDIMSNYTGLLASYISNKFNKVGIIFTVLNDTTKFKGSIRNQQGIDIFNLIPQIKPLLLQGGGHNYAYGFTVCRSDFVKLSFQINQLIPTIPRNSIEYINLTDLSELGVIFNKALLFNIAFHNEYTGGGSLHKISFKYTIQSNDNLVNHTNYSSITTDNLKIIVIDNLVSVGDTILISPTIGKRGVDLIGNILKYKREDNEICK